MARRMKRKKNIGIIFIDHLTQIKHSDGTRDYRIGLNQVSNDIYALAAELNVPFVVLAQIGREAEKREDKRPRLADIKESGKIEEDCDLAIGLYREDYYSEADSPYSTLEATILKNRHGKSRITSYFEVDKSTGEVKEKGQTI
jgi:replicative DNA helicase